jgi:hypothetical protein
VSVTIKKIIGNAIYLSALGYAYCNVLYIVVDSLSDFSPFVAFAGNLLFILLMIAADEYSMRMYWRPDIMYARLARYKNAKHREIALRFEKFSLQYYVSFRTFLFGFYIIVLIVSQIAKLYPDLLDASIVEFLGIIEYSVIFLLAFKDLGEEFPRDRKRAQKKLNEFEEYLAERQD